MDQLATQSQPELLDLWRQFGENRSGIALSRQQRTELRARLGELLDAQQTACRALGHEGHFVAWLQANHIAASTAYRLIQAHRHPHKPRVFIKRIADTCLNGKLPEMPIRSGPGWKIRGRIVTFQLTPRQAEMARRALAAQPASNSPTLVEALLETLKGFIEGRRRFAAQPSYWSRRHV